MCALRVTFTKPGPTRQARPVAFFLRALLLLGLLFTSMTALAYSFWEEIAPMNASRAQFKMTTLQDGRVLVAGGFSVKVVNGVRQNSVLAAAELYDPAKESWKPASNMTHERAAYSATLLHDGKVLVAGGAYTDAANSGFFLASAELYDPVANTWTPAGSMATLRSDHTATLLPNNKVLVVGGNANGVIASAELYDPASNTWSAAGNLSQARTRATATFLTNGKVLIAAGDTLSNPLRSAELYDPVTNTWSAAANLNVARYFHTATLLSNGTVMVIGGTTANASTEFFNPATNTWTVGPDMLEGRELHTATLLPSQKILVTGGTRNSGDTRPVLASAELYDSVRNSWSAAPSMRTAKYLNDAALLRNGSVLVGGGLNVLTLNSAEIFHEDVDCNRKHNRSRKCERDESDKHNHRH